MPNLIFEASDAPLDSFEFISFLHLFRAAYARSLEVAGQDAPDEIVKQKQHYAELFGKEFNSPGISQNATKVSERFYSNLGTSELNFVRINKSSPLEIGCICVVSALTLAVIVSGGEVDIKGLKFKLRPLGVGIKNLRAALRIPQPKRENKNPK